MKCKISVGVAASVAELKKDPINTVAAGGGFPVNLVAGEELPSGVFDISVVTGNLLCFYK